MITTQEALQVCYEHNWDRTYSKDNKICVVGPRREAPRGFIVEAWGSGDCFESATEAAMKHLPTKGG